MSNNKRILIYGYDQDVGKVKDQQYYLKMFEDSVSGVENNNLRYIDMNCDEKFGNNSLFDQDDDQTAEEGLPYQQLNECKCGKYELSATKPYKMLYAKVYTINKSKTVSLCVYDWAIDKSFNIESLPDQNPFIFSISPDGKYVAYSDKEGRVINVKLLGEAGIYCTLWVSRSLKMPLCWGFLTLKGQAWFSMVRHDGKSGGNMHLFKLEPTKEGDSLPSEYKRGFSMYEKTMKEYRVRSKQLVEFYADNDAVYCLSVCGVVHDMIDMKRSGNWPKKDVENFVKWSEEEAVDND